MRVVSVSKTKLTKMEKKVKDKLVKKEKKAKFAVAAKKFEVKEKAKNVL